MNLIICWLLIILLLLRPGVAHNGFDEGMKLFLEALFPYLLPYLILTQWVLRLSGPSKKEHSKGWLYFNTYCISALGGFPTGAATVGFLKNQNKLSSLESKYLLGICHAPSPLFVIGYVGGDLLHNPLYGWKILLLFHLVNLIFLGWFYSRHSSSTETQLALTPVTKLKTSTSPLIDSIKDSIPTLLLVGATVIFFTTISHIISRTLTEFLPNIPKLFALAIYSSMEMTSSLHLASQSYGHSSVLPLLLVLILSVQGISIHLQVAVLARAAQISIKPYLFMRIVQIVVVPTLFFIFFL